MKIPDHILEEQYLSALDSYYRKLAEHIVMRTVKSSQARVEQLHECAETVRAMEASFPKLKNLRQERELRDSSPAPTDGLPAKLLLPDLPAKGVK